MAMTDPIADLLTRIRNAQRAKHDVVKIPYSRMKERVAEAMLKAGFLRNLEVAGDGAQKSLSIHLKYFGRGDPVISGLKRVSKPGCRVYRGYEDLARLKPGMGSVIISTPKGVINDNQARELRVGGEVICQVW